MTTQISAEIETRSHTKPILVTTMGLFVVAALLRIGTVLYWHFDGLYGQDSFAYFDQSVAILMRVPAGQLPPLDFFWPNGYPILVALVMAILGETALAGQLVSLLTGVLIVPLFYLLTNDLFQEGGHRSGILAGLIVAVAGQPILSSVVTMADMAALFWATLAAWLTVRAIEKSPYSASWFVAAGAAIALAVITRWVYLLLAPALVLVVLYNILRRKMAWWQPLLAALSGCAILLPQLWLSLNRPDSLLHSWLLGWHPLNFFLRQFENIDGQYVYPLPVGLFYAQPAGHPAFIFPLLGLGVFGGMWHVWRHKNWNAAILLGGWLVLSYGFLAGIPYQNFRFGLSHYPPLVILASVGINEIWSRIPEQRTVYRWLMPVVISLSLIGMLAWAYPMLDRFLGAQNQTKEIARNVAAVVPADGILLTFGLTLTFHHYTSLDAYEFFYCDQDDLNRQRQQPAPLYLLLDVANVESQWQGRDLHTNYLWLQEQGLLELQATFPPYHLFAIQSDQEVAPLPGTSDLCAPPEAA